MLTRIVGRQNERLKKTKRFIDLDRVLLFYLVQKSELVFDAVRETLPSCWSVKKVKL